ncbi:prolyl oligopeptidase family serine peptidase [Acidimicrobiaceae bacterium]|nr:prolyl oligopeptidase family serine peptidase [Acidimicrobiaceae bacterium]
MRKVTVGILFFIIIAYFGIGFYVYGESVAVPCAIVESEKENRPDNFTLGEKADWDPSKYFVQDYETVLINTNDDVVLSGWWMETDKNAPTIIGLHGVTSGKHSPDVLLVGGMLVSEGFNYLTFDFRDHGESTCEDGVHSAGQKEIYDVKAAIDWLTNEKDIPSENIGLHGSSFGAMVALMTQYISDDINALSIVDTPFDFATLVREELVYQEFPGFLFEPVNHYALLFEGVDITEISPEDGVSAGRNPMIIFNGVKSDRVLSHHTDDLISAGNKYSVSMDIHRYEELSHTEVMYAYPDEFQNKAVDFFKENLNR